MFQILIYLLCKNCNPPEKSHPPSFPVTLLKKLRSYQAPFLKIWLAAQPYPPPPAEKVGGVVHSMIAGTIYAYMNMLRGASNFKGSTFENAHICAF